VNRDEPQESLASQAAAWVPPWEREAPEAVSEAAPPDAPPTTDRAPLPDPEPLPGPEPLADQEPEPQAELDAMAEPDLDPEDAAGTPELDEEPEPDFGSEPEDIDELRHGAPVEVTAAEAPEPEPHEAAVTEPEGEELSPEAAGTPVEEAGEDVPAPEEVADTGGAGQLVLEGFAPPPGELPAAELRAALEAILLVVDEPVGEPVLAQALDQPRDRIAAGLSQLAGEYEEQDRGFELRRAAGGWRLYTRARYAGYVERFVLDGQSVRLTQAALETLAVVAYKQPVTRSRISAIRGVNCDGVVRTLVTRGLIEECGAEPETGAHLYRTTSLFLEKLGLDSVEQLPPLAPFLPDDVDAIADAQSA
jgi:segregation and condensation protein B